MQNVQVLTDVYAKAVQDKLQEAYHFMDADKRPTTAVEVGRKYFKVIAVHPGQRSVHSFVDRITGDVFKPAGWAAPAKGARFNLLTGMSTLLLAVDPYGGYLYKH